MMHKRQVTLVEVDATFRDIESHFEYRICYASKRGFLAALTRSKKAYLVNAVDVKRNMVVRNNNLAEYRKMK